jgi:hypothetical protein
MGWLLAIVVLPVLFMLLATYIVLKLAVLILRVVFIPLTLLRR